MNLKGFSKLAVEHSFKPRNRGALEVFNGHSKITGPCGDTMEFWVQVKAGSLESLSFVTDGCHSSMACGSMTTVLAEGKSVSKALELTQQKVLDAFGEFSEESQHCALLAVNTLKSAIKDYMKNNIESGKNPSESPCASCTDKSCSAAKQRPNESDKDYEDRVKLQARMCRIKHKIVVMSGKGGVGKSTVAVNLATAYKLAGMRVGLLDVDIHGPSIPTMLDLEDARPLGGPAGIIPVDKDGMKVISLGFLLQHKDDAVIWRGPRKMGVIKQFLTDVEWGDLDYLIIDTPPGTGDEQLSLCQLIEDLEGAVIVTTPQRVATADVRKSVNFCKELKLPVIGVIENMSGFVCPKCGEITEVLSTGGGEQICKDMKVNFLGKIPMDPLVVQSCDSGKAFITEHSETPAAECMKEIIQAIGLKYD
ncbi:MAG: P-loop NTPase [Kiritimatiellae bacterium]|nr:P-loop NTPase [Kiritimatiellia bacterium]